jgi:hypothetical protein
MTHYCQITYTHNTEYVPLKYKDFAIIIGCDLLTLVVCPKHKVYKRLNRKAVYPQSALLCQQLPRIIQSWHCSVTQTTLQRIKAVAYLRDYTR